MAVVVEMAIGAVHPFLHMDIHQVHWSVVMTLALFLLFLGGRSDRLHQLLSGHFVNRIVFSNPAGDLVGLS